MTFIVFFLAPPLLGFVAQYFGIRTSYLVCLPVILLGLWAVPALSRTARPDTVPLNEPATPHG